jgi:hypothetical protein
MRQVGRQRRGQLIGDVADRWSAAAAAFAGPGEGVVHGRQQRVDLLVLGLHRVEHRLRVVAVGESLPQRRPDHHVLGGVVQVQLPLERLPAGPDRGAAARVRQVGEVGRAGQPLEVAAERSVRGEHDREVGVAGPVPGRVAAG